MLAYVAAKDGARIAVRRSGSGPALVFLTNWSYTAEIFEHQERYFREHFTVYLIEPRGHGSSPAHPTGNDYATHAADLEQIFAHFNLQQVHLVGWYSGGATALAYMERFGTRRIASLTGIDLNPQPIFDNPAAWSSSPLSEIADHWALLRHPETRRQFHEYFATTFGVDRPLTAAEHEWLIEMQMQLDFTTLHTLWSDLMLRNYRSTFVRVAQTLPLLGFYARHWFHFADADMAELAPQMQRHGFGGHVMFWEYAERFNAELHAFLRTVETQHAG